MFQFIFVHRQSGLRTSCFACRRWSLLGFWGNKSQISMENINVCLFILFLKIHIFNFDIVFYKYGAFGLLGIFSLLLLIIVETYISVTVTLAIHIDNNQVGLDKVNYYSHAVLLDSPHPIHLNGYMEPSFRLATGLS